MFSSPTLDEKISISKIKICTFFLFISRGVGTKGAQGYVFPQYFDLLVALPPQYSASNFHFLNRNVNPIIFGIWDGKNSLFITQGTLKFPCSSQFFPIHGLAVVVNKKSTIRSFAAHGGFFIHHAC